MWAVSYTHLDVYKRQHVSDDGAGAYGRYEGVGEVSFDAPLFIKAELSFARIAETIHRVAFPDFECE